MVEKHSAEIQKLQNSIDKYKAVHEDDVQKKLKAVRYLKEANDTKS
jgi:hypothetical protein